MKYFYPRPPRGGRRAAYASICRRGRISIHALREEGDDLKKARKERKKLFLSTPSARRATRARQSVLKDIKISIHALREEGDSLTVRRRMWLLYFYPRPPRGGRLRHPTGERVRPTISIHALREEGDVVRQAGSIPRQISIHALREEGDGVVDGARGVPLHFYPRPPRGGRPGRCMKQATLE